MFSFSALTVNNLAPPIPKLLLWETWDLVEPGVISRKIGWVKRKLKVVVLRFVQTWKVLI